MTKYVSYLQENRKKNCHLIGGGWGIKLNRDGDKIKGGNDFACIH